MNMKQLSKPKNIVMIVAALAVVGAAVHYGPRYLNAPKGPKPDDTKPEAAK